MKKLKRDLMTSVSNDNLTACEKCNKVKDNVRFEGSEECFICDGCLFELRNEVKA